jgi:photosystem II stability/assembly factor-like uncharacterized protein
VVATCEAVGFGPGESVGIALGMTRGGTAWKAQNIPKGVSGLLGIACGSAKICEAVGQRGAFPKFSAVVLGTTNGGTAWKAQGIPSVVASLNGIDCVAPSACFASGANTAGSGLVLVYR